MKTEFQHALTKSLPIAAGYLSLGFAFGVLLSDMGYHFLWATFSALIIFAGAMQFVMLTLLDGSVSLPTVAIMTLLVNSRHAFYGLSFIPLIKGMGKKALYFIHSLTDESYSLFCTYKPQEEMDNNRVRLFISVLCHIYWIGGCTLGALIGGLIPFDTTGIDFAMTAMFITIFIDQWKEAKSHVPAITGIVSGILCLIIFGPSSFILPTILLSVAILILARKQLAFAVQVEEPLAPSAFADATAAETAPTEPALGKEAKELS